MAPLPGNSALNTINSLASFNGANGTTPNAPLVPGPGGLFYGTTFSGGANASGTVYSFDGTSITGLASFNGTNGANPNAALTPGPGGLFYGITERGGANNLGTVFSFNSNTNSITTLASFNGTNGQRPQGALTPGLNGLFYGTTLEDSGLNGSGTVYSFDSITNAITSLASFNTTNGRAPTAALTPGPGGLFYGTTQSGGANNLGTVYSFDSITNAITRLASFNGTNGQQPRAKLTPGPGGLFYGTTQSGGANNLGTVYSFDSITNAITSLASFNNTNGQQPFAELTPGPGGLLYGTTRFGGANNRGTVYSFDTNTNTITSLASFNGPNGAFSRAALTAGPGELFYGTTEQGGTFLVGAVFSIQVPGPLPILGAGMAFGWSRRIRKRIRTARLD